VIQVLNQQYELVQGSREVVLNFIDTEVGEDLNKPVGAFEDRTIRYLLIHTVNTYFQWLGYFAMKMPFDLLNDEGFRTIDEILPLYKQMDELVTKFLNNFQEHLNTPLDNVRSGNRRAIATPLELFTHVMTHEFHHKGQIMTMCRMLGYTPPDTDVIRF